jgi:hypothetical protein
MISLRCPLLKNYKNNRRTAIITQLYGENGPFGFHSGIDFKTQGTMKYIYSGIKNFILTPRDDNEGNGMIPIIASHSGELSVGFNDDYKNGIYMKVRQENAEAIWETLSFHLSRVRRWKGDPTSYGELPDFVQAGTVLGWGGNSGQFTTGPHLHFELRKNGERIDPMPYFTDDTIYQRYYGMMHSDFFYKGKKYNRQEIDEILNS